MAMATALVSSSVIATVPCSTSPSSPSSAVVACSLRCTPPLASRAAGFSSLRCRTSWPIEVRASRAATQRARGVVSCSLKKLAEVEPVELTDDASTSFPAAPGIYAVYDKAGDLQYVGLSRRVSASLQSHLKDLPELCASAKVNI